MRIQKMIISGALESAPFLKILIADTFLTRFCGLMFRKPLPPATALMLAPCNSVHMCFMRFALDIVYLDKDLTIIKIVKHLRPWIGLSMCSNAWATLEMTAGEADRCGLQVGQMFLCTTGKEQ